jgi:hypothetical protein
MTDIKRGRRMPFVILPWSVLDDDSLTAHDVLVYATISKWADNVTGVAWPSRSSIAHAARCDVKTVDNCVRRLIAAGYLEKHKRRTDKGDESNVYVVHEIVARQETLGGEGIKRNRGGERNGKGGANQTVRELDLRELDSESDALDYTTPADPSEWAPIPADVRAMLRPQPPGEAA